MDQLKFDQIQMMKNIINLNKMAFEKTYSMMGVFQDQTEKTLKLFLHNNNVISEQAKKAVAEWVEVNNRNREELKERIDEGYRRIEELISRF